MKKKDLLHRLKLAKPKNDPVGEQYPEAVRGLFTIGRPQDGMTYDHWVEALADYTPQLIELVLDEVLNTRPETDRAVWAPLHALFVLSKLAPMEAVEPLLEVLDWDDDWVEEPLQAFYETVGAPALAPLKDYTMDRSHDVQGRGRALDCLSAIAQNHPESRDDVIGFLAAFLDRPGADETQDDEFLTADAINGLLDLKAGEAAPAIRRAFEENRVDLNWVSIKDVNETLELNVEDGAPAKDKSGLHLMLKCKVCGRERSYTVQKAYFDIGIAENSKRRVLESPLIIPERISCPKCGAVDQYDVTTLSEFAILGALLAEGRGEPNPMPGLQTLRFTTKRYGLMGPRAALARYKAEVAEHPDDVDLRLDHGAVLRFLGYRDEARDQFEQALMLDPRSGEALIEIAQMAAQSSDLSEAIALWERIERKFDDLSFAADDRAMRREEVAGTLTELRAGIRPDYHKEMTPIAGPKPLARPAAPGARGPQPSTRSPQPAYGKVGRNEPCPCGSGKKYKQCHGRK